MFNPYAIGFVCVAATALGGADYVVQAKVNGSFPGQYPLSDYVAGYKGRVDAALAAMEQDRRQAAPARSHLPGDIDGWTRRDWVRDDSGDAELMKGMTFLEKRLFKDRLKDAREAARGQVYEYVRGEAAVRLSANFVHAPEDGPRQGPAEAFVAPGVDLATARLDGYDVVKGVPFLQVSDPESGVGTDGALMLHGLIGEGVAIGVHAEAPSSDGVRALLGAIDYDALNAMLDAPQPGIGSAAPELTAEQERALLDAAAARSAGGKAPSAPSPDATAGSEAAERPVSRVELNGGQALGRSESGAKRLSEGRQGASGKAPKRLRLSGGRSCLGGSAGAFCD